MMTIINSRLLRPLKPKSTPPNTATPPSGGGVAGACIQKVSAMSAKAVCDTHGGSVSAK